MQVERRSWRLVSAGLVLAALVVGQHQALASSNSFSRSFTTPKGTFTQTGTSSYTPSTGVVSRSETTTGPKGATQTTSYTKTPDGKGGFSVTQSFKGFAGKTYSSTRQFGP